MASIKKAPWEDDPQWYKDAIIYEVHVRAFHDSDGDGIGDFSGLESKLDYLQDLGVTAIWLLPFYPSPLRDDGYDIADYTAVHPNYGTLREFTSFLREARRRGLHVITELILNHTSDQHPWFQRARHAKPGSRWRDFYVWSDTAERYREARIIFKDFESSNWAWDPMARAYYWHRFYSHQPDLNYDNPLVRRAVLRVLDFWMRLGVSGVRLDAVPYLFEREGTNCENLPETHALLKELRKHLDQRFPGRMLLAEANQWPEDAAAYFGQEDECHMAFHFPVMPRLFMALRMEDRFPVVDIFSQTPPIPATCQWALFLRNHDELTLEMVTDEERDYMYRLYAADPRARINLGIRRRLAPLLNNDRKKIELMNGLLFSLPGAPVLYYGDEIGIGDNFYLGDRNGVRTPMQWSGDRNAGFSRANPQRLYLPVIVDSEYHYEAVNVEAQQRNPDSLLWWMKRLIALRKQLKAFSRGSLEFLYPDNTRVLAFVRRHGDETVLVVANLSRMAQHVHIGLTQFQGKAPVELFGRIEFPPVGQTPYFLTLGPYAFYWFSLQPQRQERLPLAAPPREAIVPTFSLAGEWHELFARGTRPALEGLLVGYIRGRRWFGGKARDIQSSSVQDIIAIPYNSSRAYLVQIKIAYTEGEPDTYVLPITFASGEEAAHVLERAPHAAIIRVRSEGRQEGIDGLLYDATADGGFCHALLESIARPRSVRGEAGTLVTSRTRALQEAMGVAFAYREPTLLKAEQSNTSVMYGDRLIFKLYRRLGEGVNPELEIGRFLTEETAFPQTAPVLGALEYRRGRGHEPLTIGVLHGFVPNQGDAWRYTLDSLGRYFEQVLAHPEVQAPPLPNQPLLSLVGEEPPPLAKDTIGAYLISARLLGQRTAELHLALASDTENPAFAPEPFSLLYQRSIYQAMRTEAIQMLQLLRRRLEDLPKEVRQDAEKVLGLEMALMDRLQAVRRRTISAMRTRIHGDYHLGQVLYTGKDFVIIDFEGEPARSLSERRLKRSPLRDVAGMLRSFHYASVTALQGQAPLRPEDVSVLEPWANLWQFWVSAAFLDAYLDRAGPAGLVPQEPEELGTLLNAFMLNKAVYEVGYELNNRPAWVKVPLQGIVHLLETPG